MSYPIEKLVAAFRTNRREFGDLFFQSQAVLPIAERIEFEAVASANADDKEAFKKAVEFAISKKFIESLILVVAHSTLENGALLTILNENDPKNSDPKLQAITNAAAGFSEPDVYQKGIMKNMRLTGKVIINGAPAGMGVLIGPNFFLTAWHVTRSLFDQDNNPIEKVSLSVEFDNFVKMTGAAITSNPSLLIPAHDDWYVTHSLCNEAELLDTLPDPKDKFADFWDYTIIQLKRPLGYERSWVQINPRALVPPDDAKIILFQHPAGQSLKIDVNVITSPKPSLTCIPKYRFLHKVNALGGASGGPCFDKEFTLIGIHQGSWPEKINNIPDADDEIVNRGIPIDKIYLHYKATYTKNASALNSENPFWCIDKVKYEPIIGRDDFQLLLWDSFINPHNTKRLFEIRGSNGSGKTFLTRLAHTALNEVQHLKIDCPAELIGKMDVPTFINYICNAAGSELPKIPSMSDFDTTIAAWMRNILADPLLSTLDKVRDKRFVWIMITDLNKFAIEGENLSEFILLLFESVRNTGWLRIITDGFPSPLPISIQENTQTYRTREISYDDIVLFLSKSHTDKGWDTSQIDSLADLLHFVYTQKLPDDIAALYILKQGIINLFEKRRS